MVKEIYEVKCPQKINKNQLVEATVPGSKSITNRALLLAAMANGTSTLKGCLTSDDAIHFLECLKKLGFPVKVTSDGELGSNITITGFGGEIPCKKAEIYVGSAGTAARFLVAMLAFSDGEYKVNSSEQMKKRPMQPLIDTLRSAGAKVECTEEEGHFPLYIVGASDKQMIPDCFTVNIDKSSQFLSALLIAVGTLKKKAKINVIGTHGLSYVDLTVEMMKSFGIAVEKCIVDGQIQYLFSGEGSYKALEYPIEPDMSAAAYFYALAAVLGANIRVKGVHHHMLQGDIEFLKVLEKMGCEIKGLKSSDETIAVCGPEDNLLKGGFTIDMSTFSDQALTLAALAPFADAPITITGIAHIRLQECDRIKAIVNNLTALGIKVDEKPDAVTIYPGKPTGCDIETYEDHRVAMSFTLTGLRTPGVRIIDPLCCKKTFAEYFEVMEKVLSDLEKAL
ncbi:MAG: 3-phosphoshikimate 1-carboxyvinyltransferase [Cellulosilyticum sp.]|nr:3-phosphoshikimate 1-carboxyvinyltransferase [Cellulosilyticum sp.]